MSGMHDDKAAAELIPEAYFSEKKESSKGCLFGCLGCFGVLVLGVLVVIGVGYYATFHSSAPLKLVEAMIEGNEGVEIQGLSGTISNGFHVEEITYQSESVEQLSKIENVEFRFNGISNLFREDRRLIIEEFSVESGTFYFRSDAEPKLDMQGFERESNAASANVTQQANASNSVEIFKEVRIDLIEFSDLKIIDVETGKASELNEVSMSDFHYLDGTVRNVGEYSIDGLTTYLANFELENFSGNPAEGFSIDRLRVKNSEGQWSDVKNIQFEFNGLTDIIKNKQLIIDRLGVESGVFYIAPFAETTRGEVAVEEIVEETAGAPLALEKVLIKEISFPNLTFINPATDLEFHIKELSFRDFEYNEDSIVSLGDIKFEADHIQIETGPSDRFDDQPSGVLKQKISGTLGVDLHSDLKRAVDFRMDMCFVDKWQPLIQLEMCEGQINYAVKKDAGTTTWRDFKATDWLVIPGVLVPEKMDGTLVVEQQPEAGGNLFKMTGTIQFGNLDFEILGAELIEKEGGQYLGPIPMKALSSESDLKGELYLLEEKPFLVLKLSKNGVRIDNDAFARALWGTEYAGLDADQILQTNTNSIALEKVEAIETGKLHGEDPGNE